VLGKGNPEGLTAYVLRKSNFSNDIELWNACSGQPYYMDQNVQDNRFLGCLVSRNFSSLKSQPDAICQLKELNAVVSSTNIYINSQEFNDPSQMAFDFTNQEFWMPFLKYR